MNISRDISIYVKLTDSDCTKEDGSKCSFFFAFECFFCDDASIILRRKFSGKFCRYVLLYTITRSREFDDRRDNDADTSIDTDGSLESGRDYRRDFPGNAVSLFLFRLAEGCIVVEAIPLRGHCLIPAGEKDGHGGR